VGHLQVRQKGQDGERELHIGAQLKREGKNPGGSLPQVIANPDLGVIIQQARDYLQTVQSGAAV
jgi:hypothetical protein